jgi:hypothetical protein
MADDIEVEGTIRLVRAVPVDDHREALARIQELERRIVCNRVCPECGPTQMDGEGCCPTCGATVDGTFIRKLLGEQEV